MSLPDHDSEIRRSETSIIQKKKFGVISKNHAIYAELVLSVGC